MKTINIIFFFFALSTYTFGQSILGGTSSADLNTTVTYTYNRETILGAVNWDAGTKGTVVHTYNSGTTYYADIKWIAEGTGTVSLSFLGIPGTFPSPRNVTISAPVVTPNVPIIQSENCGSTVLAKNGTPPAGTSWYWQGTNANGTFNLASSTITASSSGTYYIRAYKNGVWSPAAGKSVTVKVSPSTPTAPSITKNCGNTVLTRTSPPSGVTWYWQTSSTETSTSSINSASTYTRTSNGTMYLRARHNSSGCWSASRTVSVSVNPNPGTPSAPSITKNCGNTVLTRGSNPSGITWYWQTSSTGTSTSNSSSTYTRTSDGTVYLRGRNNNTGCWGSHRSTVVTVNAIPSIPSTPNVTKNCGNTVLTRGSNPSGITWYWQTSSGGTSTSSTNSASTYTRNSNGTVYLRARNNSTNCWGTAKSINVTVNAIPPTPSSPIIAKNCGNTVLTRTSPPSGITWYWQTSSTETSTSNSSSSYTRTTNGPVYLRARNNTTNCWGVAKSVIVSINEVPSTPSTPSLTKNCGNTVLTRTSPQSGTTWFWQTSAEGTSTSSTNSASTYTRTSNGTVYLRAKNNSTNCWGIAKSINVTVNAIPSIPSTPSVTKNCGNTVLTRGSNPSGITWYWQTSSGGTSTSSTNSASTYTRTSNGTVYLRGRNNSTNCWGTAKSIAVTINTVPPIPSTPSTSKNCGNTVLTKGSNPGGITWYWQTSSGGTSTSSINSASTYTRTSNGNVYLRARNNATNCWGTAKTIAVTVDPIPSIPLEPSIAENCGNTVLTMDTSTPTALSYFWQTSATGVQTASINSSSSYTAYSSGTLYLRARDNSGCWGSARSVNFNVKEEPSIPPNPIVSNNCGNTTMARLNPPSGETWYWQTSITGTSTSTINANQNYTVTTNGTVYLRAKNNTSNCWSPSRPIPVTITQLPNQPSTPSITQNCGSATLNRGSVPSGKTWYWQTSSTGISTSNSGSTLTMSANGTAYIRARDNATECWSTTRSIAVTLNAAPPIPAEPASILENCGSTVLTMDNSTPSADSFFWQTSENGQKTDPINANQSYTVLEDATTIYLRARNNSGCWGPAQTIQVNVKEAPDVPTSPIMSTGINCGSATIARVNPPSGETWYWQTSENGTSTASINANTNYTVFETRTIFLRSLNDNNCWGPAVAANVNVTQLPAIPQQEPVISQNCGEAIVTIANGENETWYWQISSGATSIANNTKSPYTVPSDRTIFLRVLNNSTQCWSDAKPVTVTVEPIPEAPSESLSIDENCGNTVISIDTTIPTASIFFWQTSESGEEIDPINASSSYTVYTDGSTIYLRENDNGCWGPAQTIQVNVKEAPDVPTSPIMSTGINCGSATIARVDPPSGETWYWQTSENGENTGSINADANYTVFETGTIFLRSLNDNNCWGPAVAADVNVTQLPAIPQQEPVITQNCGEAIVTIANGENETWYWQISSGATSIANNTKSPYTVPSDRTIFLRVLNNSTQCWSDAKPVPVTVEPIPEAPSETLSIDENCGNTVISIDTTIPTASIFFWQTSESGEEIDPINASSSYTVYTDGSTIYLRENDNGCWGPAQTIQVNVKEIPGAPTNPIMATGINCGSATIARVDPPSGETWYWQTSENGTSTAAINADTNYTVFESGTIYLRSLNNNNCWGPAVATNVNITQLPAIPQQEPVITQNCGEAIVTIANGENETWYWQISSGATSIANNTKSPYTVPSDRTIFLRVLNNSTQCWSDAKPVPVTVEPIPEAPSETLSIDENCGNTVISIDTTIPTASIFFWQTSETGEEVDAINASSSYTVYTDGSTIYLRENNNGCWGPAQTIQVNVKEIPGAPANPIMATGINCGSATIARVNPPIGETWYWQTSENGTSKAAINADTNYTVFESGTIYLRSLNNNNCWGPAVAADVNVTQLPAIPQQEPVITQNCGEAIVTIANGANETWYWQISSGATSIANNTKSPYTVPSDRTIFLRVLNNSTQCWSDAKPVTVTVEPIPEAPSETLSIDENCGNTVVTMDDTTPTASSFFWQTSESGEEIDPINANSSYTVYIDQSTIYLRENDNGCWGPAQTIQVNVKEAPDVPTSPIMSTGINCGSATIARVDPPDGENWYWQTTAAGTSNSTISASSTYTMYESGTIYLRAISDNGCWGTALAIPVTITSLPIGGDLDGASNHIGSASGTLNLANYEGTILKWQSRTDQTWSDISNITATHNYSDLDESTYFRVVVSSCANEYSNEQLITVLDEPQISWGNSFELRPGDSEKALAEVGYANYDWKKDGISTQSGSNNEYDISSPGDYQVVITNAENNVYNSEIVTFTSSLDVNKNVIISYSYLTPTEDEALSPHDFSTTEMRINAQFYDGLGRPIQSVSLDQSPLGADIVVPMEYDPYGRQIKSYLPYPDASDEFFKSNALNPDYTQSDQNVYYSAIEATENSYAFSESLLEPSPLGRTLEQGAPGIAWQLGEVGLTGDHTVQYRYDVDDSEETYNWDFESFMTENTPSNYVPRQLLVNVVIDEDDNETITYTNKLGQTILKKSRVDITDWAETYYIYDDFGQLKVVLPPMAVANLNSQFFGQSAADKETFLANWAFTYSYDSRNRMISKQVPGAKPVHMVYDIWDRLVLTQDGEQRKNAEWLFTSYDALNRPVITGILSDTQTNARTHTEMQNWIMGMTSTQERSLTFSSSAANVEYTSNAFPFSQTAQDISIANLLTVTYYDNYNWDTSGLAFTDPPSLNRMATLKGQVTGSLTKIGDESNSWIKSVSYYDYKYRPIQTQSTNHLGGKDVVTNYYDFIGQVEKTVSLHYQSDPMSDPMKITRTFTYDHANRLLNTWHQLNTDEPVLLVNHEYNEIGELITKNLHSDAEGTEPFQQTLDYTYNIRGWLREINPIDVAPETPQVSDLFNLELLYNTNLINE